MSDRARADQVLDAAERRMRTGGYHAVSFRDVAADVGIRSASVHHHFPQKSDLGAALVARYRERFLAALEPGRGLPAQERLRMFCEAYRRAFRTADAVCLCGMLGAESHGLPEPVGHAVREFFSANIAWVAECLAVDRPMTARRTEATSIVASLQGAMMLAAAFGDAGILDEAIAETLRRSA